LPFFVAFLSYQNTSWSSVTCPCQGSKAFGLEALLYVRFDDRVQVSSKLLLGRCDVVLDDLLESSQHGNAARVDEARDNEDIALTVAELYVY